MGYWMNAGVFMTVHLKYHKQPSSWYNRVLVQGATIHVRIVIYVEQRFQNSNVGDREEYIIRK